MTEDSTFKIKFAKNRLPIAAVPGATLMQTLLDAGIAVASSCRGDGVCAKCRIQVIEGHENLTTPQATEIFLKDRHSLEKHERVSCQVQVLGDITVDAPYW